MINSLSFGKIYRTKYFGGSPACAGRSDGRIMWFVYVIKSQIRNWYYVGSTNNLERRLTEHNNGKVSSTKRMIPFNIVFVKEFTEQKSARLFERLLKDKRIEKERIIKGLIK